MPSTKSHDEKIANLTFTSVYPHYLTKVERKGKTKEDLHKVINWLTGFDDDDIAHQLQQQSTFKTFFEQATLHPNANLITGKICGYVVEDIQNELTRKVRYLDKLVDELANGKKIESILRTPNTIK